MTIQKTALITCLTLFTGMTAAHAQTRILAADPADGAAIAVYSDGLSVVGETRSVTLPGGPALVSLPDLPEGLDLSSLAVRIGGDPAGSITIRRDSLSPQTLLQRSLGQEISWLVPVGDSGAEREIRGTLINVDGGLILKVGDRYEAMPPNGRLALDSLPPGMTGGLEVTAHTGAAAGSQPVDLRYVTPDLRWSADYTAFLTPDESGLTLSGHYLIDNGTATGFTGATIRLVAGETTRVHPMPKEMMATRMYSAPAMASSDSAGYAAPEEATLGDVHVYDVAGRIDLPARQTVRRVLLAPVTVPAEKRYRLEGSGLVFPGQRQGRVDGLRPSVTLTLKNDKDGPLARALPAGPVRVFGTLASDDANAPAVILGEDHFSHLPVGGTAELSLGRAFDVTGERRVLDYETTGSGTDRRQHPYRARHEITLRNGRAEAVTVELAEALSGQTWSITEASTEPESRDARSATWQIDIPAGEARTLTYTVRVTP